MRPASTGFGWSPRTCGGGAGTIPRGGVLWDLGPHFIDQALVLFGEPETIWAAAFCQRRDSKIDDSFDVHMEYSHLRATLRARSIAYAPGPHQIGRAHV